MKIYTISAYKMLFRHNKIPWICVNCHKDLVTETMFIHNLYYNTKCITCQKIQIVQVSHTITLRINLAILEA